MSEELRAIIGRYGQLEELFWVMLLETTQERSLERVELLAGLVDRTKKVIAASTDLIRLVDELESGLGQLSEEDLARVSTLLAQLEASGPAASLGKEQPARRGRPERLVQPRRSKIVRVDSVDDLSRDLQEAVRKTARECCKSGAADTVTIRARVKEVTGVELSPRQAASYIRNYHRYWR